MLILCIYLTVSIFLYCLCVGLALKDDKEALDDYIQRLKTGNIGTTIFSTLLCVIIAIPAVVYFMIKDDEEP